MHSFFRKYFVVLVIILSISSYSTYLALKFINTASSEQNNPKFNENISGSYPISVFFGSVGDNSKCDALIQVKRGVQENDKVNGSLKKIFEGPLFAEELVVSSAFKGYDKIYNGVKIADDVAFVDFKSDLIDPNSSYFKDFTKVCAISQFNQIVFTLKQFKEVKNVVIAIDGNPRKFMQSREINCELKESVTKFEKECLTKIP